jgi:hypothetical protein
MYCGPCWEALLKLIDEHKQQYYVDVEEPLPMYDDNNEEVGACDVFDKNDVERYHKQHFDSESDESRRVLRCYGCSRVPAIRQCLDGQEMLDFVLAKAGLTKAEAERQLREQLAEQLTRRLAHVKKGDEKEKETEKKKKRPHEPTEKECPPKKANTSE